MAHSGIDAVSARHHRRQHRKHRRDVYIPSQDTASTVRLGNARYFNPTDRCGFVHPVRSCFHFPLITGRRLQASCKTQLKNLQFTRTIRKSASSMLSAALQLFLLIKWRSLCTLLSSDFRASTESELRRVRVNCNGNMLPVDILRNNIYNTSGRGIFLI